MVAATADPGPLPAQPAARYLLPVPPELTAELVRDRLPQVNLLLRASLLGCLQMDLEVALNVVADHARELVPCDRALLYLWDDDRQRLRLLAARPAGAPPPASVADGTRLSDWTIRHGQPIRIPAADAPEAAAALAPLGAGSALAVPLFVSGQPRGSLELFARRPGAFSAADARLLVVLALQAELLLHCQQDRELLARLAATDPLTGLYNRRHFDAELARELARAARGGYPVSLLLADVDHFKRYNDRYTHLAGDAALREIAAIVRRVAREADTACRYGGEEFVLILPATGAAGALTLARRIARAVARHRFPGGGSRGAARLTLSIGTATAPADGTDRVTLLGAADRALYLAKARGRNRVVQARTPS